MEIKQIQRGRSQPRKCNDQINVKNLSSTYNCEELNKKPALSGCQTKNRKDFNND